MKMLFLSDVHGITDNIEIVLPHLNNSDLIVLLGDIFHCGELRRLNHNYDPHYLFNLLKPYQNKIIAIEGNTDYKENPFDASLLKEIIIDDHHLFLTHGHYYQAIDIKHLKHGDVFISGHTHVPIIKKELGIFYLNPGSLSLPKNSIASYMIYENNEFIIYDINHNIIDKIKL